MMRLVTYREGTDGEARAGVVVGERVRGLRTLDPTLPPDVLGVLQGGEEMIARLRRAVVRAGDDVAGVALADARLLAPIPRPPKIVCIGVNYADHAAEAGRALPPRPSVFLKAPSCVIGPHELIVRPPTTEQLDYEVELAAVIGRTAKAVRREDALSYVAGYTIMNDVSARDLQFAKDGGIIVGKNFDTAAPLGPVLVLADEIPDPTDLGIRTWINGQLRQDSTTHNLIFDVPAIISYVTQQLTLEPGDVIATGTPAGVGLGLTPQVWLRPGDRIRMEIDGIGTLENTVA